MRVDRDLSWLCTAALMIFSFAATSGCGDDGASHPAELATTCGDGPRVIFDPLTEHTPEVPFPNDIATVIDTTSPTGRRVNVRVFAPTVFEQAVRRQLSSLDGFGTFAPISIAFDQEHPLDLSSVTSDVTRLDDRSANTVLLVDIGEGTPYWGSRFVPLDAENDANFPIHIDEFNFPPGGRFFPPYTYGRNERGERAAFFNGVQKDEQLLFRPDNEQDLDGDGVPELLTNYEVETNTLILRPLFPLRQRTEYVMVVTKGVTGRAGDSVCAPESFPFTAHATQMDSVRAALPHLAQAGVAAEDIAFAWSFTTQSVTEVFDAVADGMDGLGSLAFLEHDYPAVISAVTALDVPFLEQTVGEGIKNPYLLSADVFTEILDIAALLVPEIADAELTLDHVDYCVFGAYETPNFRATPDEIFDMDLASGRAAVGVEEVPFVLCVPKTTAEHQPPFPVTLYCHGNTSIRLEALASANELARNGVAILGIDAVGHGPILNEHDLAELFEDLPPSLQALVLRLLTRILGQTPTGDTPEELLDGLLDIGFLNEIIVKGRAVDLTGDGNTNHGENFWSADTFKTRDIVRQTVIDLMRVMRILEAFDQTAVPPATTRRPDELSPAEAFRHFTAGDFNMDGILDAGGTVRYAPYGPGELPSVVEGDQSYFQSGISLGGIISSIMIGAERRIEAGVPVVPGGGLTDVMARSNLKSVMYRIYYEVLGPVILGEPGGDAPSGSVAVRFENNLVEFPSGVLQTRVGGRIHVENLDNDEEKWVDVMDDGGFVIGVAADKGHVMVVSSYDETGELLDRLDTVSPLKGFGLDRNTPRFRRFMGLAQMTLDPADPINYAPRWFLDPPEGWEPKNVLQITDPGDLTVPINNQLALARAAGLLGDPAEDLAGVLAKNNALLARQVFLGLDRPGEPHDFPLYDPEDMDGNNCSMPSIENPDFTCDDGNDSEYCRLCREDEANPLAPFPPVDTGRGKSLLRLPFGKRHEFHALPLTGPDYAPGYYGVYTRSSQSQTGVFLGLEGTEWRAPWDCRIERTWQADPDDPSRQILVSEFAEGCPWDEEPEGP